MKYLRFIKLVVFIFLLSCQINGNFKGLYSYYDLTQKDNPNLFVKNIAEICNLSNCQNVYVVNGYDIKNCLKNDEKSLVYIWGPKCTSKICIPLDVVQKICTENDIRLYIVAEYYDSELMNKKYNIEQPIFGIDTKFYRTDLTKKYLNSFLKDLTNENYENKRYLYFEKGILKQSFENLDYIETIDKI